MDSDQKVKFLEDPDKTESNTERKARRSSILKPQKPRNPLTTLDFSEPNPDNTLAKASRRVSFASSNFVKPFAADPEKNTIWDTTYEEEINHTDSTKSSYEQTHEARSHDFLNVTSIHCLDLDDTDVPELKIWESDNTNCIVDKEIFFPLVGSDQLINFSLKKESEMSNMDITLVNKENLNVEDRKTVTTCQSIVTKVRQTSSFKRDMLNNVSSKKDSNASNMEITLVDKENIYFEDKRSVTSYQSIITKVKQPESLKGDCSLITPFSAAPKLGQKTCTEDEMEITKMIDKENLNPIINDIIFAVPLDIRSKRKGESDRGNHTIINQSDMELTKTLAIMDIKENVVADTVNKTVYFTEDEMEFTGKLDFKSKTIYFDEAKSQDLNRQPLPNSPLDQSDMEFTSVLPGNLVKERTDLKQNQTQTSPSLMELTAPIITIENVDTGKMVTHKCEPQINLHDSSMELTETIPNLHLLPKDETIFEGTASQVENSRRKTIHFNESSGDMDITLTPNAEVIEENRGGVTLNDVEISLKHVSEPEVYFEESCEDVEMISVYSKSNLEKSRRSSLYNPQEKMKDSKSVYSIYISDNKAEDLCPNQTTIEENSKQTESVLINKPEDVLQAKCDIKGNDTSLKTEVAGVKRLLDSKNDSGLLIKKKNLQNDVSEHIKNSKQTSLASDERIGKESLADPVQDRKLPTDSNQIDTTQSSRKPGSDSISNVLYSEPLKIKLKTHNLPPIPDLSDNLNLHSLNGTLNLKLGPTSTPATSFHMTLTDMSPCMEDTQQLIYATFSKPEQNRHSSFACDEKKTESVKPERSCYIEDESAVDLDVCDNSVEGSLKVSDRSERISDISNYTLRTEAVLTNIQKYLRRYEINTDNDWDRVKALAKLSKENCSRIGELNDNLREVFKVHFVRLEERYKQDKEESSGSVEVMDNDKGAPSTAGLVPPKTLHERICDAAERSKEYWRLEKFERDVYYFVTLFGALPFKVDVHADLGTVYGVKTYTHLDDDDRPICWYELRLFQQKLEAKNLSSVLGTKFDILTLLDYVYITMEEIVAFHLEYSDLVKRCGASHHFRMNKDFSVTFEVINIYFIVHWVVTVAMSPNAQITRDSVTAVTKVGQNVNEEDIKRIAENTPKGAKFFTNFIENVDDYLKRISKRLKYRQKGPSCK